MDGRIIKTLCTMEDLSRTGYGCPNPRHRLKLLRWLAQNAIYFDNNGIMRAQFQFHNNQYGFHCYSNYEDVLPALQWDQEYFEVGNLNYSGADALPYSVRAAYDHRQGNSYEYNMDRIVVQCKKESDEIGAVYITEHSVLWHSEQTEYLLHQPRSHPKLTELIPLHVLPAPGSCKSPV